MDIKGDEREFWRAMRALTIDAEGHEVFVGLSPRESEEYLALSRRNEAGEDMNGVPAFDALQKKHEAARQEIVDGRARLDG